MFKPDEEVSQLFGNAGSSIEIVRDSFVPNLARRYRVAIGPLQTVNGRSNFSEAAVQKSKTGAVAPVLDCSFAVYQADNFCFLRRANTPSSPRPASIMA